MIKIDPQAIAGAFTGSFSGAVSTGIFWLGRILVGVGLSLGIWAIILFIQYKYRIYLYKLEGGAISKPKWERAKKITKKGVPKWNLLMSRKKIKPVDYEYVYPGNKVYLLRTGDDTFIPMKKEITLKSDNGETIPTEVLRPLEEDVTYWYQLQQRDIAEDYRPDDAAKKQMMIMFGSILLVLIFAGFVLWLSFSRTEMLVNALNSFGSSQSSWLQNTAGQVAPN